MNHVVLLGDSVFDNGAYVGGGPDVLKQVRSILPADGRATMLALDGAVLADIEGQLRRAPADATHLVMSAGGNDALMAAGVLEARARSVAAALSQLAQVRDTFQARYAAVLDRLISRKLPTAVCTIYDARFPDREQRRQASAALAILNDAITREAFARKLTVIDLRLISDSDADFANPIEPSVAGGAKIADAIVRFAGGASAGAAVIAR